MNILIGLIAWRRLAVWSPKQLVIHIRITTSWDKQLHLSFKVNCIIVYHKYKISQLSELLTLYLCPYISLHILHTVIYTFLDYPVILYPCSFRTQLHPIWVNSYPNYWLIPNCSNMHSFKIPQPQACEQMSSCCGWQVSRVKQVKYRKNSFA